MEQMVRKLKELSDAMTEQDMRSSSILPPEAEAMREASILWSKVCLQEFRDDLLRKGLEVSIAITDFLAEMEASLRAPATIVR